MDLDFPYYPIHDFGPAMKGLVIGALGIVHVFLAQFAIGAGMLMCYFQWLSQSGRCHPAQQFLDGYFRLLVLVSFVAGALTGVGMWFTTIQISPRTIGMMVDEFHWVWATEWTFFCVEIVAGYCFYRYGRRLLDRERMRLLVLYTAAAWFSLFWINGILSWQLTPSGWLEDHRMWSGFFNASFFPSLIFRTITSMTIASLVACMLINALPDVKQTDRARLVHYAVQFLGPMVLMPALGAWYLWSMPDDSRTWVLGGSPTMALFLVLTAVSSAFIGLYALIGLIGKKLYINGATATLLCGLAFVASAAGEFIREGSRKPYTVRGSLYSNSIRRDEVARLRQVGSVTADPYPLRRASDYPDDQLRMGAKVYRLQCSVCHTRSGMNGLTHLTGTWSLDQKRMNIAKLQHTKPFMPPFAGNAVELEALVQYLSWEHAGRPPWRQAAPDPAVQRQLEIWLRQAGTAPGSERQVPPADHRQSGTPAGARP